MGLRKSSYGKRKRMTFVLFKQSELFPVQSGSSSLQKPCVAEETPQSYGIHTYTEAEIQSKDLTQNFRKFWNKKANELCKDKNVKGKLRNKMALKVLFIHGGHYIR